MFIHSSANAVNLPNFETTPYKSITAFSVTSHHSHSKPFWVMTETQIFNNETWLNMIYDCSFASVKHIFVTGIDL